MERIGTVDRTKVKVFEETLINRTHALAKRQGIYDLTGCDQSIVNGVLLNHLEDWRSAYDAAIVPRK